jgi:hypothetical protein
MRPEAESKQGSRQEKWRERSSRTTIEFIVIHSQQTSKLAQAPGQNSIGTGGQYWIGVNIKRYVWKSWATVYADKGPA